MIFGASVSCRRYSRPFIRRFAMLSLLRSKMFGNVMYVLGIVVAIGVGMQQYTCGEVPNMSGGAEYGCTSLTPLTCSVFISPGCTGSYSVSSGSGNLKCKTTGGNQCGGGEECTGCARQNKRGKPRVTPAGHESRCSRRSARKDSAENR